MQGSHNQFFLQHGGEIRESLIMIEGDDGSFELLAHGWLAGTHGNESTPFALSSKAAIPIAYTCWSRRPIAIPTTYTTGIGSDAIHSARCRIAL